MTILATKRLSKACSTCGQPITLLCVVPGERWIACEADPPVTARRQDERGRLVADVDDSSRHRCNGRLA